MEDCCLEQDLADHASPSLSNQSMNAQHPAGLSQQKSILLQEKNSSTSIWLENSVNADVSWMASLLSVIYNYLTLFIGAYHLAVLGPWAARVLGLSHDDTEILL